MSTKLHGAIVALLLILGSGQPAAAWYQYGAYAEHGVGLCQPAREYPDLRIRQREIDNIGSTNAYVVCSLKPPVEGDLLSAQIYFRNNRSSGDITIVCNLQDGYYLSQPNPTTRKELVLGPEQRVLMEYTDDVFNDPLPLYLNPGVQCILPPGASIDYVNLQYRFLVETSD